MTAVGSSSAKLLIPRGGSLLAIAEVSLMGPEVGGDLTHTLLGLGSSLSESGDLRVMLLDGEDMVETCNEVLLFTTVLLEKSPCLKAGS